MAINSDEIDKLEARLNSLTSSLYDLSPNSLQVLTQALDEIEFVRSFDQMDFGDFEEVVSQYDRTLDTPDRSVPALLFSSEIDVPLTPRPLRHGMKWSAVELESLDRLLRIHSMTLADIAFELQRSVPSIRAKGAYLVRRWISNFQYSIENAMGIYHNKVSDSLIDIDIEKCCDIFLKYKLKLK